MVINKIDPESFALHRYFNAGPCELRLGVYESFDTLCIYLESDALAADPERNFWVKYRCAAACMCRGAGCFMCMTWDANSYVISIVEFLLEVDVYQGRIVNVYGCMGLQQDGPNAARFVMNDNR